MLRIPKVRKICVGNPHLNWQPHFHFHKCAPRKIQHEQWAERLPAPSLGSHCFLGEFKESKALHFLLHAVGCYRFISLYSWKEGKPKWEIHQMPVGMKKDPSSCLQRETRHNLLLWFVTNHRKPPWRYETMKFEKYISLAYPSISHKYIINFLNMGIFGV